MIANISRFRILSVPELSRVVPLFPALLGPVLSRHFALRLIFGVPLDRILPVRTMQSMSLSKSHPLQQQSLRTAQRFLRAHRIWLQQRQIINDLRERESQNALRTRSPQDLLACGCSEKYDRLRVALDRLYEVRESQPLFRTYLASPEIMPTLQRGALKSLAVFTDSLDSCLDQSGDAEDFGFSVVDIPVPPGANLRTTPRCPGAPSLALPH